MSTPSPGAGIHSKIGFVFGKKPIRGYFIFSQFDREEPIGVRVAMSHTLRGVFFRHPDLAWDFRVEFMLDSGTAWDPVSGEA
jgi:hypothetical protein